MNTFEIPSKLETKNHISGSGSKNSKKPNPTLGTIQMVEKTLSEMREYPSKNKLWRQLPRQIQYPSFKVILDYLEDSNKIIFDDDGAIVWTFSDDSKHEKLKQAKSFV